MKTKYSALVLLGLTLFFISASQHKCKEDIDLDGTWKFRPVASFSPEYRAPEYDDTYWRDAEVPGQWQQIPGLGTYHGRGVYRTKFEFNKLEKRRYELVFDGVFYKAWVYLNGKFLGSHEGYFEPFEFNVTDGLLEKNVLVVEVECLKEKRVTRKNQILGVFGNWDVISGFSNPGGIWGSVWIATKYHPAWIESVKLTTVSVVGDPRVRVEAKIGGKIPEGSKIEVAFGEGEEEKDKDKGFGFEEPISQSLFSREYILPGAKLWWTHDRGLPFRYKVMITLYQGSKTETKKGDCDSESNGGDYDMIDYYSAAFGIRTIEVKDQYHFYLNGQSLYIKGNNYAPSQAYLSDTTDELLKKDLEMMKAAHYNMVRVHAHVDDPDFYSACDEAGILVFQDFPLQWGYDPAIKDEAIRQAKAMIALLYNHPSIAIWNCHNEPLAAGVDRTNPNLADSARDFYSWAVAWPMGGDWNLKTLDPLLEAAIKEEDSSRPVNRASGPPGYDLHQYKGWYGGVVDDFGKWFQKTLKTDPAALRFVTEFGAQAFPNYESALKMMPDTLDWDLDRMTKAYMLQPKIMGKFVPLEGQPDLKSYIAATQDYQARLLKYHIEYFRRYKYQPNYGVIAFLHNDSQMAVTWSVVDFWREPKKAYFTVQESFSPVWVMTPFQFAPYRAGEKKSFPIYIVNDTLESHAGRVTASLEGPASMKPEAPSFAAKLSPDMKAEPVGELNLTFIAAGTAVLTLTLAIEGSEPVTNRYELFVK